LPPSAQATIPKAADRGVDRSTERLADHLRQLGKRVEMSESEPFTLADIASQFAAVDSNFRHFHGKLFSFIPPEQQKFADLVAALSFRRGAFPNCHPATIIVGKLAKLIELKSTQVMAVEDGRLRIFSHFAKSDLPDWNYLAMISPIEKTSTGFEYALGFESINFLRSLLSLAFGKLPFYTWIADFDFDEKGVVSLPSELIRMPMFADYFKVLDTALLIEVLERLATQQADYRKRLQRACDFFDMALDQKDEAFRFSSYWIALEIIVGGKSDAIRSKLSASYGQRNKAFANEKLLFKEIEQMRHDLIHKGEFKKFESYQERLLHLYFWDIVIHQIGLRPRGLALLLANNELVEEERNRPI
jgi:hypothetical protein